MGATGRYTYTEMMNLALNQVLARSINTTVSSIIPVLSMLVIGSFILGATTLQDFSIALLVGLLVGGYSSLFIASFVVAQLKEREPEYEQIANKVAKKSGDDDGGTRSINASDIGVGGAAAKSGKQDAVGGSKKRQDAKKPKAASSSSSSKSSSAAPPKPKKSNKTGTSTAAGTGGVPPKPRKTKKKR